MMRLRLSSRPAMLQMVAAALACRSGEAFCIKEMRGGMAPARATARRQSLDHMREVKEAYKRCGGKFYPIFDEYMRSGP